MKFKGILAALIMMNLLLSPVGRAQNSDEKLAGVRQEQARLKQVDLEDIKRRAFAGNAQAQFALGLIYEEGRDGIKKDLAYALSWYEEAAHNGLKSAIQKLQAYGTSASDSF